MSNLYPDKISRLENYSRRNNAPKAAWALALRCFAAYKLLGDRASLERGIHLAHTFFSLNFHFIHAYYLLIYMELLQSGATKALKMLDRLKPLKGGNKGRPMMLATQTYLRLAIDLKRGKARSARKGAQALASLLPGVKESSAAHYIEVLLAAYYISSHERDDALRYLVKAHERGHGSMFFFICLHDFFVGEKYSGEAGAALLHAYLKFALSQGLLKDLGGVLDRNKQTVAFLALKDKQLGHALYDAAQPLWLLKEIAGRKIKEGDYSADAFKFYNHAKNRQLDIKGLATALVRAGKENDIYDMPIDRYTMGRYFEEQGEPSDSGEDLFTAEMYSANPAAKYVWVFTEEKDAPDIYEFNMSKALIRAADLSFTYILLDESEKNIIAKNDSDGVYLRKVRDGASDVNVMLGMFKAGDKSPELLIALTKHFMSMEELQDEGVAILREAAANEGFSLRFREGVRSALGYYYASGGSFHEAVRYYEGVQPGLLTREGLERMLLSLVTANKLEQAAKILSKHPKISDGALFFVARKIAADKSLGRDIASFALNLTLNGRYDKALAAIALGQANAGQSEWHALSRTLAGLNAADDALDENILNNAIFTHNFTKGAQGTFARFFYRQPKNPYIMAFALYTAFEIIVRNVRPEYETLDVLEKIANSGEAQTADLRLIHYALCHVYIDCGITTAAATEIISRAAKFLEKDGFIFPVFKEIKDKSLISPYIEKNQPFIYRAGKGKRVKLLYKSDTEPEFSEKTMRYVRFGLYSASIPIFYGEKLRYMYLEEADTGSISTIEAETLNNNMQPNDDQTDLYYAINNAIIYESMFKYEAVEEIITDYLKEPPRVKGWLM